MPLNPEAVGATGDVRTISWNSKDALLYAVGIGAGSDDLPFTTENTSGVDQVVFPTFAVVAGSGTASPGKSAMGEIGTFNWAMLVHGSQAITLHRPIPVEAQATTQDTVVAMYDKGKAAVVVTENEVKTADGQPLWTTRSSVFIRGEGGWGGDRGPSGSAERTTGRSTRSRSHVADVARPGVRLPALGRPQSAAHRSVVRCSRRFRSADPAWSVHVWFHWSSAPEVALRQRRDSFPSHRRTFLVAGDAW